METKLLSQQGKANKLMELEFVEASDTVLPVTNDKLRRSLYREAEAYLRDKDGVSEGVPIQRLARILAAAQSLVHCRPLTEGTRFKSLLVLGGATVTP